jgi:hypothetical protein
MSLISLAKIAVVFAVAYPFGVRVWRNLRRPLEALSEHERRLLPLWRWQAVGIGIAVIALAMCFVLLAAPVASRVPFWTVYALVILSGSGVLIAVHARALEDRDSAPASKRLAATRSGRYQIAWKLALVGCVAAFFASLSVTSFRSSAWLAHPLLIATYVLIGIAFVLAAMAGWTSGRG